MDWRDLGGQLLGASAPTIGSLLGGLIPIPGGSYLGQEAGTILAKYLGVEAKPEVVHSALATDATAIEKIKLAEVEAAARWPALADMAKAKLEADTAQFKAQLGDVQDARSTSLGFAKVGSRVQYGASIISAMIVLGFIFCIYELFQVKDLTPNVEKLLDELFGSLTVLVTMVGAYWLGSSAGSKSKDDAFADFVAQSHELASDAVKAANK